MTRRELLTSLLVPAGLACAGRSADAQTTHRRRSTQHAATGPVKLERVGVSSQSFNSLFLSTRQPAGPAFKEQLVLLDLPQMVADRYKVHNLEFAARHFASVEPAYFTELKSNLVRARSRLISISVDVREIESGPGLSDPAAEARENAIATAKKWIDIARQLGARSISCAPGTVDVENLQTTVDSFRQLAAYGRSKSVAVLVEDRAGTEPSVLEAPVSICRGAGGSSIGILPDFGNFPDEPARTRVLPKLFTCAHTLCHATGLKLDASGHEMSFSFQGCVQIARKSGFRGIYSVDYTGDGNPYDSVQAVVNELLLYL